MADMDGPPAHLLAQQPSDNVGVYQFDSPRTSSEEIYEKGEVSGTDRWPARVLVPQTTVYAQIHAHENTSIRVSYRSSRTQALLSSSRRNS